MLKLRSRLPKQRHAAEIEICQKLEQDIFLMFSINKPLSPLKMLFIHFYLNSTYFVQASWGELRRNGFPNQLSHFNQF